jgi:anti-sigma regulatory factor (Ser/Thr protein kinase)
VGEACANAIEHAYGAPGRGELEVSITRRGDEALLVTVRDFGRWKDPVADPERGRGTPLMKELADEVLCHTDEEGTTVMLRFDLAERALSAIP